MLGTRIMELALPHPLASEKGSGNAQRQCGLFATQAFEHYCVMGEYIGEIKQSSGQCAFDGEFCATLEEEEGERSEDRQDEGKEERRKKYVLDAGLRGNEARFINHYEGIASKPNVIMKTGMVDMMPRRLIIAKCDIAVGEEILVDYGPGFTEYHFDPATVSARADAEEEEVSDCEGFSTFFE
eukprot:g1875.t1